MYVNFTGIKHKPICYMIYIFWNLLSPLHKYNKNKYQWIYDVSSRDICIGSVFKYLYLFLGMYYITWKFHIDHLDMIFNRSKLILAKYHNCGFVKKKSFFFYFRCITLFSALHVNYTFWMQSYPMIQKQQQQKKGKGKERKEKRKKRRKKRTKQK